MAWLEMEIIKKWPKCSEDFSLALQFEDRKTKMRHHQMQALRTGEQFHNGMGSDLLPSCALVISLKNLTSFLSLFSERKGYAIFLNSPF